MSKTLIEKHARAADEILDSQRRGAKVKEEQDSMALAQNLLAMAIIFLENQQRIADTLDRIEEEIRSPRGLGPR